MKRSLFVLSCAALVGAAAFLPTDPSAKADAPANPFAGHWIGTFYIAEFDSGGDVDMTVAPSGEVKGLAHNTTVDAYASLTGHIGANGAVNITGYNRGGADPTKGTATIALNGHMLTEQFELRAKFTLTTDLVRQ